jgi:hypothetical protein
VYKNDKDYTFRQIQAGLKAERDKSKYMSKRLAAETLSDIDHILSGKTPKNNVYKQDIVDELAKIGYPGIYSVSDLYNIKDKSTFRAELNGHVIYLGGYEQSMKLLMNSMYGGCSHVAFYWYNMDLANDITGESRNLIHIMENHIPDFWMKNWVNMSDLHKKLGIKLKESFKSNPLNTSLSMVNVVYGDTDSVNSKSIIEILNTKGENERIPIDELFDRNEDNIIQTLSNGTEIAICEEKVLNWNGDLRFNNVNYIMRHKVSKPKWRLKTKSGKDIIVTNDHSMIVFRDGEKIEVKPCEILKTDKILTVKY